MSFEQSSHGRECRQREFAGGLIGKIGANGFVDFDHSGKFRAALELTQQPFSLRPVARLGALAYEALPFQASTNPFWATATTVVNISVRTGRIMAGVDGKQVRLLAGQVASEEQGTIAVRLWWEPGKIGRI